MKPMNFYTANGWAGSNYDSKLSTKEIAAKVRAYAKKNFPGFKFSIKSKWSMYTDSLYIELKEGTCIPFVEGSRSAERGYMSTMSTVKGWEKELTPEMFAVLDAVTTYVNFQNRYVLNLLFHFVLIYMNLKLNLIYSCCFTPRMIAVAYIIETELFV